MRGLARYLGLVGDSLPVGGCGGLGVFYGLGNYSSGDINTGPVGTESRGKHPLGSGHSSALAHRCHAGP